MICVLVIAMTLAVMFKLGVITESVFTEFCFPQWRGSLVTKTQRWLFLLKYAFSKKFAFEEVQLAYDHNEAIEEIQGIWGSLIDEYSALSDTYSTLDDLRKPVIRLARFRGPSFVYLDGDITVGQYLCLLSNAINKLEHVLEYMSNPNGYVASHWDFYHGLPKGHEDSGDSVPL